MERPTVRMLGTHGVPAAYGGFETAVEQVSLHLVERGWRVIVYCQTEGTGPITQDTWRGVERINIPTSLPSWLGTSWFDWHATAHAANHDDLCIVFGYNTAIFNLRQKFRRTPLVFNMDGIEWTRARWGLPQKAILYTNERVADVIGDHLIADHPEIEKYLQTRAPAERITRIAYGAPTVTAAPTWPVTDLGLEPGRFLSLICRPVPENSILELVTGFSRRERGYKLVIVGDYDPDADSYHRDVVAAASDEVVFAGSIYDPERVSALRFHSALYLHGHTVGGTNPSLVEALGAGNPVLAHDNPYNRWTAGDQVYFRTADDVAAHLDRLLTSPDELASLSAAARTRHAAEFTWDRVAGQYEDLLRSHLPTHAPKRGKMKRDPNTVLLANPGSDLYGSDRMLIETVRAVVDTGRRAVVTVPQPGPLVELLEDAGAEVVECPTPTISKSLLSVRGLARLISTTLKSLGPSWRLLREVGPAQVVVNTITSPLWLPLAKLARLRTVCHVHEAEMSANPLLRRVLYLPLIFADRLVINSRFSLGVVELAAPWLASRTDVVYNAVAGPDAVTPPRPAIDGPVRLLYFGRLSERKGPHVAIDAVRLLRDRGVDAELSLLGAVFPGNESYQDRIEAQVRELGLTDRVHFLGFRPSVWPLLAETDIAVIPSTVDEPFGNTAVEAGLAARPLIVSAIAGLKEAAGRSTSAISVPAKDATAIADAVVTMVENWPDYADRAVSDSRTLAVDFSHEQYADGMLQVMRLGPSRSV